ncbi:MAG: ribosome biogenesis GTPase YlqF, partial [Clostridium sp.]|nr:ribosome biogenesis GTPase YlqF [Clostridium sp.]
MNYQWYPGHMTKAKRMMQENISLVDVLIELLDARIPRSSKTPDIDTLGKGKKRIILLNKADLADPATTAHWLKEYSKDDLYALDFNAKTGAGVKAVHELLRVVCAEKRERDRKRGIVNRPIRVMIAGIPNVGKSTFINAFAGRAATKTGNKPGVTKGKQWIRLNTSVELLDTPGLLWPRFDDPSVGRHLAWIGSMNDEVLDV